MMVAAGAAAFGVGNGLKLISEKFLGLGISVKWRTLISKVRTTVFGERVRAKVQQDSSWEDVRTGCKRPLICLEEIGKELRIGAISVLSTVAIANGSIDSNNFIAKELDGISVERSTCTAVGE